MIKYSKPYDWPMNATNKDIERNVNEIILKRDKLLSECTQEELVNTKSGTDRIEVLEKLAFKIASKGDSL